MVAPSTATIVMVPFPFSDLSAAKYRPAVVLAEAGRGDWLLCMVTSRPYGDPKAVRIEPTELIDGKLDRESFGRPLKLFTAHQSLMATEVGRLRTEGFGRILDLVIESLRPSLKD